MRLLVPFSVIVATWLLAPVARAEEPLSETVQLRDAQKRQRLAALQKQHAESVEAGQARQEYAVKLAAWRDDVDGTKVKRQVLGWISIVGGGAAGTVGTLMVANADDRELKANEPKKVGFLLVGSGVFAFGLGLYFLLTQESADELLAARQTALGEGVPLLRF